MRYDKAKIYCIRNHVDDEVYIGSTTQLLSKRFSQHVTSAHHDMLITKKIKELGKEVFYIELIKEFPCDNKEQLLKEKGEWIRKIGSLNQRIAGRTLQRHYEDNKDMILAQKKEYHEKNRDTINEHHRIKYHDRKVEKHQMYIMGLNDYDIKEAYLANEMGVP